MYYNIELDWDPKVIGVKNGVYQVELDKSVYNKATYSKIDSLFMGNEFTANQFHPEIGFKFFFKKFKSTKKTSFMSFTPYLNHCLFLVHNNILELFKSFNMQYYKNFESVIYESNKEQPDDSYKLFYSVLQDWDVIDFKKTVFTSGGYGNNPKIEHKFKNEFDMLNFNGNTNVNTLVFTKSFDKTLDFFHTRLGGLFISEKLKLALEENNATGIKYNKEIQVMIS